ncbi:hypothetical protein C8Q76DRAFT_799932 [Earliella scabrosa]|nr:hypothetical protein C8Q76DRAFT_801451 [Earliella scabrosa]KAI0707587.1 hypothetical protein C8Q76DRAFT_799932 [Earliella scabrosa]
MSTEIRPFQSFPQLYLTAQAGPGTERPWPRSEVWIGHGRYEPRHHPEHAHNMHELEIVGPRVRDGTMSLYTMVLPDDVESVRRHPARWQNWIEAARGEVGTFPVLDREQARGLLDMAMFLRILAMPEQTMIPQTDWPHFCEALIGGLTLGIMRRGERRLQDLSEWLRARYPEIYDHVA